MLPNELGPYLDEFEGHDIASLTRPSVVLLNFSSKHSRQLHGLIYLPIQTNLEVAQEMHYFLLQC